MSKRSFLFIILAAFLLACTAAAETMLDEDGLRFSLTDLETYPGGAGLTVVCSNIAEEDREVLLLTPEINGQPAGFEYGWGSYAISIPAAAQIEVSLPMEADDPAEVPETLSMRFAANGRISSACALAVGNELSVTAASFALGEAEPQLVDREIEAPRDYESYACVLTDTLSIEETQLLDYGRALICLRGENDEGELLTHICTCEVVVDGEGNARADYSGLALILPGDDMFLVSTQESAGGMGLSGDMKPLRASLDLGDESRGRQTAAVALSGDAAFFASLTFQVNLDETGDFSAGDVIVSSAEIGGDCTVVPCALFNTAQTSQEIWRAETVGSDEIHLLSAGAAFAQCRVDGPLRFKLVPASELGSLAVCFEYFFTDGSDVIHPPVEIDLGND